VTEGEEDGTSVPDCPICLTGLEDEDGEEEEPTHTTSCGHTFHADCLKGWRGTCVAKGLSVTCPNCRAKM
jgi:hypothetical protein